MLRVSCIVNVKLFGLNLLCKRPEVFMIPRTFQKSNSFLKLLASSECSGKTAWIDRHVGAFTARLRNKYQAFMC